MRITHRDVGDKSGPRGFCNGDEFALCTEDWLDVTCPACHEQRSDKAPLSNKEIVYGKRATGPGTSRPLTAEEVAYDNEHSSLQRYGRR